MTPAAIIERATEDGITFTVSSSGRLLLKGSQPAIDHWLEFLRENKTAILVQLQADAEPWSIEDWRALYDERAGIAEFDGGLPRSEAETLAFECCVVEWLNRTFERSPPGSCLACCGADSGHDALLPHGVEPTGHVWLHSRCWPAWHGERKAEAVTALKAMGIHYRSKAI
jgi:hypothetical protein